MEEIYVRQKTLPLKLVKSVAIIGIGGTGFWAALFACLSGAENLYLYDADYLELSNFGRIALPPLTAGQSKATVAAEWLSTLRPDCSILTFGRADSITLPLVNPETLIDCTDKSATQDFLVSYCSSRKINYIRCGYNGGDHITMTDKISTFKTTLPPTSGYEIIPSWVGSAALPGLLSTLKLFYDPTFNFSGYLYQLARTDTH
jgi:tRNA A37 threonylcarbamoyladenosine dehydratase